MKERMQESLHRWLPRTAVASMVVSVGCFLFVEYYVVPRRQVESGVRKEEQRLYEEAFETRGGELRAALERVSAVIDTLDGNRQTLEVLRKAVAQEDAIGEAWVTNAHGLIVYYGLHQPPFAHVGHASPALSQLLEGIPEELLGHRQRTAILLSAAIGGYRVSAPEPRWLSNLSMDEVTTILRYYILISEKALGTASNLPVSVMSVRGGLIAAVVSLPTLHDRYGRSMERTERLRLIGNLTTLAILGGLIAFWIAIPAWMLLDARRRGERAAAWGLFGLLGNVMALVVYLLVRRDP